MEKEESSTVRKLFKPQRAEGPATVLAIGTATPAAFVEQATYPDFYFGVTNSNHMTDLKDKFIRLCT